MASKPSSYNGGVVNPSTLATHLGIEIVHMEPGKVIGRMEVTKNHLQPAGLLHGGATAALAETLGSIGASMEAYPKGKSIVGMSLLCDHVTSAGPGDVILGIATPVQQGGNVQVWVIECMRRLTAEEEAALPSSSTTAVASGSESKESKKKVVALHETTLRRVAEDNNAIYRMISWCRLTTMSKPLGPGAVPLPLESTKKMFSGATATPSATRSKL